MATSTNPNMCKKHYRTLVFSCYINYIKKYYPTFDLNSLFQSFGLSSSYFSSPTNWVSVEFDDLFTHKLIEIFEDPNLPYKAGQLTLAKESLGPTLSKFVQTYPCSNYIYKILPKSIHYFNKIFKMVTLDSQEDSYFTYELKPSYKLLKTQKEVRALKHNLKNIYQNFIGHFCAISALRFNNPDLISPYTIIKESEDILIFRLDISILNNPPIKPDYRLPSPP